MAVDIMAGFCGGVASTLVSHPFDTVKARLQTQSLSKAKYKGIVDCFSTIIKQESVFGLYKGISSPLVGLAFINSIAFTVYKKTFDKLNSDRENKISSVFYAGAVSGFVQSFLCSPMELAKLRLQLQGQGVRPKHIFFYYDPPMNYKGPLDCLAQVYRKNGFRGITRGLPITIVRDIPSYGLYFASYEWFIRNLACNGPDSLTVAQRLFAGGVAGMLSWTLYPIDVIKSRYQADDVGKYRNVWDCTVKSYQREGWKVFKQGLASTMLRAFPVNAVTFFTVEWSYRLFKYIETRTINSNQSVRNDFDEDDIERGNRFRNPRW